MGEKIIIYHTVYREKLEMNECVKSRLRNNIITCMHKGVSTPSILIVLLLPLLLLLVISTSRAGLAGGYSCDLVCVCVCTLCENSTADRLQYTQNWFDRAMAVSWTA